MPRHNRTPNRRRRPSSMDPVRIGVGSGPICEQLLALRREEPEHPRFRPTQETHR